MRLTDILPHLTNTQQQRLIFGFLGPLVIMAFSPLFFAAYKAERTNVWPYLSGTMGFNGFVAAPIAGIGGLVAIGWSAPIGLIGLGCVTVPPVLAILISRKLRLRLMAYLRSVFIDPADPNAGDFGSYRAPDSSTS